MPEYLVDVIERQTSTRRGVRRVLSVSTAAAAAYVAESVPDDELTDWGMWEVEPGLLMVAPNTQARPAEKDRLHGVVTKYLADTDVESAWNEVVALGDRLSLGVSLHDDRWYLYFCAEGQEMMVPLDMKAGGLIDHPDFFAFLSVVDECLDWGVSIAKYAELQPYLDNDVLMRGFFATLEGKR